MSYSFSTLRKKIDKVDSMLKDLDSSDAQFSKLQSKRDKYYEQMKETPEWETEGPAIERRENLKRKARQLRETANRAEKTRKQAEEARLEQERQAREKVRRKMKEREEAKRRAEEERLEKERLERERIEQERLKREREERERLEQERLERERREQERLKREREEKERLERERLEQERLEREREEKERLEWERREQERLEREREEEERLENERREQERLEREREEEQRLKEARMEQERLEQERLEQEREERDRLERERLEEERLKRECEEQERLKGESLEQKCEGSEPFEAVSQDNESSQQVHTTESDSIDMKQLNVVVASPAVGRSPDQPNDEGGLNALNPQHPISSAHSEPAAPPQRPMLGGMGGLLAQIEKKKVQMDATRKPIEEKRVTTLKLVDAKARNESSDQSALDSTKPQHTESSVQDVAAAPPRRPMIGGMGGLLAEIGKKKEQMDAVRKPIEEKRVPKFKLVDPKTSSDSDPKPIVSTASKPPIPTEPAKKTPRARGDEKISEAFLQSRKSILNLPRSGNTETILHELAATEDYHLKLEKHLKRNGIPIPADIPYEVCKDKIASITKQMQNLPATEENQYILEKKYFELEQEMMKYSTAMMLTDEWAEEQQRLEQEWEDSVRADNINALKQVRSHMPVNVRSMTEEALSTESTPNGKILPQPFARKFKRTNVLQLLRVNPRDIEKMHPSYFEGMRTTGLTLTERRALHEHLKGIGARWLKLKADKNVERKWLWFDALKAKFKEMQTAYDQHRDDPQNRHVKADRILDYTAEDYGFPTEAEYESSSSQGKVESELSGDKGHQSFAQPKIKKRADDAELMAAIRDKLQLKDPESEADRKLLRELYHAEKRTVLLEKSLKQAGIEIPEDDIPYVEAKAKVAELTEKIKVVAENMMKTSDTKEAAMLEKEFGNLSSELTRYQNAMMESKEWAAEQLEKEHQWEESVRESNQNALKMIRRHMPVNIRDMSEEDLVNQTTPNGKTLPQQIVRKFKRTNILLLLRMDPSSIEPMHPSSLESMRTTGLTLTERRALHEHLRDLGPKWKSLSNDKMAERKWMWHDSLRSKFKELVKAYDAHVEKYGADGNPSMGNRCLVKADRAVDYSGDYGFPEDAEFKVDSVAKSNLLTMEDIKKRRQEEEGDEEEEPPKPGGFLSAIAGLRK